MRKLKKRWFTVRLFYYYYGGFFFKKLEPWTRAGPGSDRRSLTGCWIVTCRTCRSSMLPWRWRTVSTCVMKWSVKGLPTNEAERAAYRQHLRVRLCDKSSYLWLRRWASRTQKLRSPTADSLELWKILHLTLRDPVVITDLPETKKLASITHLTPSWRGNAHKAATRARHRGLSVAHLSRYPQVHPCSFISYSTALLQVSSGLPLFLRYHLRAPMICLSHTFLGVPRSIPVLSFPSLQSSSRYLRVCLCSCDTIWGLPWSVCRTPFQVSSGPYLFFHFLLYSPPPGLLGSAFLPAAIGGPSEGNSG